MGIFDYQSGKSEGIVREFLFTYWVRTLYKLPPFHYSLAFRLYLAFVNVVDNMHELS